MNKKKAKSNYTYGELIKNYYGVAGPNSLLDLSQFDALIAGYYGKPRQQQHEKSKHPSALVLSLSFDPGEVLTQAARRSDYDEYVVQSSAAEVAFEEYIVDDERLSSISSLSTKEIAPPIEEPAPDQEYVVDVLHPLDETKAPVSTQAETVPTPAAVVGSNDKKPSQKELADQSGLSSPAETGKATDADFMEDLQSILTGHKVFDPASKKTVEKDKLGAPETGQTKNNETDRPVPEAKNEQAIFDRIAQSMQYANTFDLGSVDLENRFADFDKFSELQQKSRAKKPPAKAAPTEESSPDLQVGSADFVQDLDIIRSQNAAMNSPLEEPTASFSNAVDGGTVSTTIPEIEALDLAETAKKAAYSLKEKHPSVVFTSGRRNKQDQARAMAGNVVKERKWIENTYVKSAVRDACQKWVDDNPGKKTESEIEQGLLEVLNKYTDAQLGLLTRHLSGMAFDVQPVSGGEKIKAEMKALAGPDNFLEKEGGLVRWHAEFK